MTDFRLDRSHVVVPDFAGYGAQYNQNVYAAISRDAGVTEENVLVMEQRLVELKPQLVRVFFNGDALHDDDLMRSFQRTLELAQRTASTINVTFQGIGPHAHTHAMPQFARVLHDLVAHRGISKLRWITVRNEPNVPPIPKQLYKDLYLQLDRELAALGVRSRLHFMGGDLRIEQQREWFRFLSTEMRAILDAYSIHVYWNYFDPSDALHGIESRLSGVRAICDGLQEQGKRPLYVTEYGVRGRRAPGETKADPGLHDDGRPLAATNVNAFQHAWFSLRAAMLRYRGTVKWDAYFGMYDAHRQAYSMIGHPTNGWPPHPVYRLLRLLTTTVSPGSKVLALDGAGPSKIVVGFDGPDGRLTILGLDTDGGSLNTVTTIQRSYRLAGLPPNTSFQLRYWNFGGDGRNTAPAVLRSNASGLVTVTAPLHSVFAITTLET